MPTEPNEKRKDHANGRRAWVGVVSHAHVLRGVEGGFAQLCHGKRRPLDQMGVGDALIYYSPTTQLGGGEPLKAFTALGTVVGEGSYLFDMGGGFVPHRRDIAYERQVRVVPVRALAGSLRFIRENPSWGMLARRGHFEIGLDDWAVIRDAMLEGTSGRGVEVVSPRTAAPRRPAGT